MYELKLLAISLIFISYPSIYLVSIYVSCYLCNLLIYVIYSPSNFLYLYHTIFILTLLSELCHRFYHFDLSYLKSCLFSFYVILPSKICYLCSNLANIYADSICFLSFLNLSSPHLM